MRAFFGLLVIAFLAIYLLGGQGPENPSSAIAKPVTGVSPNKDAVANAQAIARNAEVDRFIAQENRRLSVKIEKWSWKKGGFDNVMIGTFTIKNTNEFGVKDITITCKHYAPSGTLIDSNTRTVYQALKPKGIATVRDFSMGFVHSQAERSSCVVENFI